MKKIIIASRNPVKINATLSGFQKMFPNEQFEIESISVPSGVSNQPQNDSEIFFGAWNRASNACKERPDADFWVGIEGGIEEKNFEMEQFAWIIIKEKNGGFGKGRTGTYFLPLKIIELVRQGKELGDATDIVFNKINTKQSNGTIGILTNDVIDREKYYSDAVILALIPFKNRELYNL